VNQTVLTPATVPLTGIDRLWFLWGPDNVPKLYLASSYVSGTAISGSWTIANNTMTGLSLDNYGSYVYRFGSTTTDTVTVNLINPAANVPIPGTVALLGLGLVGIGAARRKRA
jgi:hypothetical protein